MKPTLVFALLVLFMYTVCAELAQTRDILASSQTRKLQGFSGASGAGFWEVGNGDSETCIPVPYVDFGYSRDGTVHKTFENVAGPPKCLALCSMYNPKCVAFNYDPYKHTCQLLSTPGKMLANKNTITALFAFVNDVVCDPANFIAGYNRPGHDYDKKTGIKTPKECCLKCLEKSPKCVAWDFGLDSKVCYLKNTIPVLNRPWFPNTVVTGFGGYCSPMSPTSST